MAEYKILIVDDRVDWRIILKNNIQIALDNLGSKSIPQESESFNQALNIFEGEDGWDLLCTNIELSNEYGQQQGKKLVSLAKEKEIPTMIVSGIPEFTAKDIHEMFVINKVVDYSYKQDFNKLRFINVVEKSLRNTEKSMNQQIFICYAHADNEGSNPENCWLDRCLSIMEPLTGKKMSSYFLLTRMFS